MRWPMAIGEVRQPTTALQARGQSTEGDIRKAIAMERPAVGFGKT